MPFVYTLDSLPHLKLMLNEFTIGTANLHHYYFMVKGTIETNFSIQCVLVGCTDVVTTKNNYASFVHKLPEITYTLGDNHVFLLFAKTK